MYGNKRCFVVYNLDVPNKWIVIEVETLIITVAQPGENINMKHYEPLKNMQDPLT